MDGKRGIAYEEEYVVNSRGVQLFTCRWGPVNGNVKGLLFLCHGYGVECSYFMKDIGESFAEAGYAVYGIDYEGHGKSDGLRGHIQKMDWVVSDCDGFFANVQDRKENKGKLSFLLGESMGGAVAILVEKKQPSRWDGLVLIAPFLKVSEKFALPPLVIASLLMLSKIIPTWKIMPANDLLNLSCRDERKRAHIRKSKWMYQDRPRLQTSLQMLLTTFEIQKLVDEVKFPFLIVHGEDDSMNAPSDSKDFVERSKSEHKTIKLYPKGWHALVAGEPDDVANQVINDMKEWVDNTCSLRAHMIYT